MYKTFLTVFLLKFEISSSCIPTQNVDPFPCKVCSKIYDSSCVGDDGSYGGWCVPADDVPVTYTLGNPPAIGFATSTDCWTDLTCPSGTTREFLIDGSIPSEGNPYGAQTLAYCEESGPAAGVWRIWVADDHEITNMRCVG
ncbi:Protein CBG04898 [Caenorhabditis briggsae]|uniref:Protein CBG04898 n=1 Tax=Caenorhabditis briggsae TaxID=6238 RepID=A8WYR4_CAEBR|nr:Protein CBG04898 [Caenorhabditis briggsae]CAP25522.1 Protein CBG04898 [Caenorhabditis briggsae]